MNRSYTSVRLVPGEHPLSLAWSLDELTLIKSVATSRGVDTSYLIRDIARAAAGRDSMDLAAERSGLELRAWVRVVVLAALHSPLGEQIQRARSASGMT